MEGTCWPLELQQQQQQQQQQHGPPRARFFLSSCLFDAPQRTNSLLYCCSCALPCPCPVLSCPDLFNGLQWRVLQFLLQCRVHQHQFLASIAFAMRRADSHSQSDLPLHAALALPSATRFDSALKCRRIEYVVSSNVVASSLERSRVSNPPT